MPAYAFESLVGRLQKPVGTSRTQLCPHRLPRPPRRINFCVNRTTSTPDSEGLAGAFYAVPLLPQMTSIYWKVLTPCHPCQRLEVGVQVSLPADFSPFPAGNGQQPTFRNQCSCFREPLAYGGCALNVHERGPSQTQGYHPDPASRAVVARSQDLARVYGHLA